MSDNSDHEEEVEVSFQGVPGCVILINSYDPYSHNTALQSYKATCEMIRRNFRYSKSNLFGLCFYGTKESSSGTGLDAQCVQIQPLCNMTLEDFKMILSINVNDFGQASDFKISDTLWHCSKMFKQCTKRLSEKTVLMLTRLDIPPTKLDSKILHQTLNRVNDLTNLGIKLNIINVSENDYKPHDFYKEILNIANGNSEIYPEPVWKVEDINQLMQQHTHRHLPLAVLNFDLGNNISIGVGVYILVQPCAKPKTVKLSAATNDVLTTTNKIMKIHPELDEEDSLKDSQSNNNVETPLLKSEIINYQTYGGEKIEFSNNELDSINHPFTPRLLKLLGFKPQNILCKEKWFLKQCHFLFPNESIVEGSTVAFKALHKACVETKMLPICVLCSRANAKPKIVALYPCTQPLGLNIDIGFDIIFLPFLENLKDIPTMEDEQVQDVDEAQKIVMKEIIKDLKFNFKADTFENPTLQSLYRAVEALALEEDVESFDDTTVPESKKLLNLNAKLFDEVFGPFGVTAAKRPIVTRDTTAKRVKEIDENMLEQRLNTQQINKYTVPELKQILLSKKPTGLPAITGKNVKSELVNLVYLHLGSKP